MSKIQQYNDKIDLDLLYKTLIYRWQNIKRASMSCWYVYGHFVRTIKWQDKRVTIKWKDKRVTRKFILKIVDAFNKEENWLDFKTETTPKINESYFFKK